MQKYVTHHKFAILLTLNQLQTTITNKTSDILSILRLRSLIAAGGVDSVPEGAAIFAAADALLGEDVEAKNAVLNGFLSAEGEFASVPCTLLS